MSGQSRLHKPSASVLRGISSIQGEMGTYADEKADEGAEDEARDIRAALDWIRAAIAQAHARSTRRLA